MMLLAVDYHLESYYLIALALSSSAILLSFFPTSAGSADYIDGR